MLSAWVSVYSAAGAMPNSPDFGASGASVSIAFVDANGSAVGTGQSQVATGEVIEGWQRVEFAFEAPEEAVEFRVAFARSSSNQSGNDAYLYVDDLRLFPADGNVQTYVYDPATFRLSATLDQNNFARLYSYDEQGNLYLVKAETLEGIMTLQVTNAHSHEH